MEVKCFAVMIVGFVLLGVASAQDYHLRANNNTNLRNTYSLNGAIIETVPKGTVLHIVGKFNRWLKINRNGNDAWAADWLSYTRVNSADQTGSQQQSSEVDNCCFVDRQCQSDEEWENGYWAYRNNQCPAPSQLAAAVVPAGPWLPSERTLTRPIIEGSEWFVYGIGSTLDLMQQSAPEWYNYVLNAADKIVESFNPATPDYPHANTGNWANGASRTIGVGAGSLSCYVGKLCRVSIAGILGHEACHIHEHLAGIVYAPDDPHWHELCQKAARDTSASIRAGYSTSVK